MSKKGFLVTVELDVQKVSCPGVYLCSNGKVSLQIHMFGSSVQTRNSRPSFPLQFYEKFVFSKSFDQDRRLNDLQRRLNQEYIYTELIQWKNCDEGRVLSTFRTTIDDLLYPATFRGTVMGVNVDLLMEPTEIFPGTIAPKLEVSTKTTVEETIFDPYCHSTNVTLITPKALPCKPVSEHRGGPRKVCHTISYSRGAQNENKRKSKKPPFKYCKVPDDLILRTNPDVVVKDYFGDNEKMQRRPSCYCRSVACGSEEVLKNLKECTCQMSEVGEHKKYCSTCSYYDNYFSRNACRIQNTGHDIPPSARSKAPSQLCSYCARHIITPRKAHIPSKTGSPCGSDPDWIDSKNRACFCVPYDSSYSLTQILHEKMSRALETNSRLLQKCIDC